MLNSPEASGRLAKWAVELGAYGITYAPRNTIKGQVLVDFLIDMMARIDSSNKGIPNLKVTSDPKEVLESSKGKAEQASPDGASSDHGFGVGVIL
ncbi:hypothetical protein Tco_0932581, partial [Tanacetum coccineum]